MQQQHEQSRRGHVTRPFSYPAKQNSRLPATRQPHHAAPRKRIHSSAEPATGAAQRNELN
jgi:hypothetical protein